MANAPLHDDPRPMTNAEPPEPRTGVTVRPNPDERRGTNRILALRAIEKAHVRTVKANAAKAAQLRAARDFVKARIKGETAGQFLKEYDDEMMRVHRVFYPKKKQDAEKPDGAPE